MDERPHRRDFLKAALGAGGAIAAGGFTGCGPRKGGPDAAAQVDLPPIPKKFFEGIGNGADHGTLLEVTAILCEGVYQDFNDPDNKSKPSPFGWQVAEGQAVPKGWKLVDEYNAPVDLFAAENSRGEKGQKGFGPDQAEYAFSLAMPNNFEIVHITHNRDKDPNSGYDAVALYDNRQNRLIIVNKGADFESTKDKKAAKDGGGAQIPDAQAFLDQVLAKLKNEGKNPQRIVFTGHSLGGVLAVAQAVQLKRYQDERKSIPFTVVTYDSIGSSKYIADAHVNAELLDALRKESLAIRNGGTEKMRFMGVDLFEEHAAGTVIDSKTGHEMQDILPIVYRAVNEQRRPGAQVDNP